MKKDNLTLSNLAERAVSPKPSFWQKVQNIALIVGAVAATVLTSGATLPALITTVATYAAVVSGTVATVAQFTNKEKTNGDEPAN